DFTALALLEAGAQAGAPALVVAGPADDRGQFRRDAAADGLRLVLARLEAGVEGQARGQVERTRGQDVHGGAHAAARRVGAAGLVDRQSADRLRGELGEVEAAGAGAHAAGDGVTVGVRIRARDLAAVERDQVVARAEATRGDLRAFTVAALDRDAGDALQRLGQVGVGELADVLGADGVDDAAGVALDPHRVLEAVAQARDDDGIEGGSVRACGRRLLRNRLLRGRVLRE